MSVNKKSDETMKKAGTYLFSTLCGAVLSGVLIAAFTGLMYVLGFPPETAGFLSVTAFAAGCLLSGFICGRIKRRRGLVCGLICAAAALAAVFTVSLISGNVSGSYAVMKVIVAALSSCTGSVIGVNSRAQ